MDRINERIEYLEALKFQIDMKDHWETEDYNEWDNITKQIKELEQVLEYAKTNNKFRMCLDIATTDYYIGISTAMEELNKNGYKTPIYWAFLKQLEENEMEFDENEMNIECRDLQYTVLNIYTEMQIAYDIVWDFDCSRFKKILIKASKC